MKKYNIDIDHVVRHYDVNGKLCPNCNGLLNDNVWQTFKNNIVNSTTGALGTGTVVPAAAKNDNLDSIISRGQQHSINLVLQLMVHMVLRLKQILLDASKLQSTKIMELN